MSAQTVMELKSEGASWTIADRVGMSNSHDIAVTNRAPVLPVAGSPVIGKISAVLEDIAWLVVVVLLIPVGILVVGTPIALCVRAVVEIVRRF